MHPATDGITVFLVDDHALLRSAMTLALQAMPGMQVLGGAKDGREALDSLERLQPQVVLMDLVMPLLDGVEATRRIRRHCRDTRVLVLTGVDGSDRVLEPCAPEPPAWCPRRWI